jgi:hypothetical protein
MLAFVIILYPSFVRIVEDEDECIAHNHRLCKGRRLKKKKKKKKVDVHLLAIDAHVIFWNNIFCNNVLTMSFVTTSSVAPLLCFDFTTTFDYTLML